MICQWFRNLRSFFRFFASRCFGARKKSIMSHSHKFLSFLIDFLFFFCHANQVELMNAIDPVHGCVLVSERARDVAKPFRGQSSLSDRLSSATGKISMCLTSPPSPSRLSPVVQRGIQIFLQQ